MVGDVFRKVFHIAFVARWLGKYLQFLGGALTGDFAAARDPGRRDAFAVHIASEVVAAR